MIKLLLLSLVVVVAFFPFLFGWILLFVILSIVFIPIVIDNKYFAPRKK